MVNSHLARSPVTMFAATSEKKSANCKIDILRLFEDCLDLSEPGGDGWTVIGDLVRSLDQENASQNANSITWILRAFQTESMIAFGPKSLWHGVQHAVRAFLDIEQKSMVIQGLLSTKQDSTEQDM